MCSVHAEHRIRLDSQTRLNHIRLRLITESQSYWENRHGKVVPGVLHPVDHMSKAVVLRECCFLMNKVYVCVCNV